MNKMLKRLSALILVGLFCAFSAMSAEKTLYILNTGDLHESSKYLSKIKELVEKTKAQYQDSVILVDAGDMLSHWTPNSRAPFTEPNRDWALARKEIDKKLTPDPTHQMYKWALGMNYDAIILGNHDFDGGVDLLQYFNNEDKNRLPFICANLEYPSSSPFFLGKNSRIPAYKIITKNGVKFGIIGISEQAAEGDTPNKDYHFSTHGESKNNLIAHKVNSDYVKNRLSELKKQSDIIVILSHNTDKVDEKYVAGLCKEIKQPCIIVGGHEHNLKKESLKLENNKVVYLIKSEKEGNYLGKTKIVWDTSKNEATSIVMDNIKIKK